MSDMKAPVPPPAPPAARGRSNSVGWIISGIALLLVLMMMVFACGTCFIIAGAFRGLRYRGSSVALIRVSGLIYSGAGGSGLFELGVSSEAIVEKLYRARKDDSVKAVLLRIDSPGGTPAGAEEIFDEVRRTAEVKPVVASIGDMGASGAYMVAAACRPIYAAPDSDVGSIGVILEIPNIQELNRKLGINYTIYVQGKYKDIGSPLRPVTPEEQAILNQQMQVAYEHFIERVADGRDMDVARVRDLATGITWPGTQAKDLGLIDDIGNFRDAVQKAGRLGGIKGDVHVIDMEWESPWSLLSKLVKSFKSLARAVDVLRGETTPEENQPSMR